MPWFAGHHHNNGNSNSSSHHHLPGLNSHSSSSSNLAGRFNSHPRSPFSSAPPSRPGSPTGGASVHAGLHTPGVGVDLGAPGGGGGEDPLAEMFPSTPGTAGTGPSAYSSASTTAAGGAAGSYFPPTTNSASSSQYAPSLGGSSGAATVGLASQHPHHHPHYHNLNHAPPLEIVLENDELVLRGAGGGDVNPALLSGQVVLNLVESTNVRELTLRLEGKGKVAFVEGSGGSGSRSHHYTHPILTHDWSFLQGDRHHAHTLKAGRHAFPFSFTFPGSLPSSLRTYLNDATIQYKLKAVAVRSTFSTNFHASQNLSVVRAFTSEALEYNQTLEIENTWPGKVMYCLTLPHKAYAAGDEIPVSLKFMPLAKGTRVTHVSSVIKEYTIVHTRHSSHSEARVAASTKHEIRNGRAYKVTERGTEPVAPSHYYHGEETAPPGGFGSAPPSRPGSPHQGHHGRGSTTPSRTASFANLASLRRGSAENHHSSGSAAGPSGTSSSVADLPDDMRGVNAEDAADHHQRQNSSDASSTTSESDVNIGDDEVDTMITIPVPSWTTPSHSIHPVFVTHKIKWSCAISNPDGHVSELRCALPIHILSHSLLDEARANTSATRGLLFGGNQEESQQVDLPSYNDHVYDRVANAAVGPTSSYVPSGHRTPSSVTPPASRGPSRPGSPVRRSSHLANNDDGNNAAVGGDLGDVPDRRELPNWADSELLMSLGALSSGANSPVGGGSPHHTPPASRPMSRMGSRSGRSSHASSRANSRASSPERPPSIATIQAAGGSLAAGQASVAAAPTNDRRHSHGMGGLFNVASLKPFTSLKHPAASSSAGATAGSSAASSSRNSPIGSPALNAQFPSQLSSSLPRNSYSLSSHAGFQALANQSTPPAAADPISQVPSYDIAARGFLGGGVVPISSGPPTYDDSETLERTKSEGDLVEMGRQANEAQDASRLAEALRSLEVHTGEHGPGAEGARAGM